MERSFMVFGGLGLLNYLRGCLKSPRRYKCVEVERFSDKSVALITRKMSRSRSKTPSCRRISLNFATSNHAQEEWNDCEPVSPLR